MMQTAQGPTTAQRDERIRTMLLTWQRVEDERGRHEWLAPHPLQPLIHAVGAGQGWYTIKRGGTWDRWAIWLDRVKIADDFDTPEQAMWHAESLLIQHVVIDAGSRMIDRRLVEASQQLLNTLTDTTACLAGGVGLMRTPADDFAADDEADARAREAAGEEVGFREGVLDVQA